MARQNRFNDLFEIGKTTYTEIQIQLTTTNPVSHNPYCLPVHQRQKLATMIAELLENKIIRKSTSSYASPIVLIPKPDGTLRLCVDYRKLNNITVKEKFPLPLIEDQIDKLVNFKYFTLLDLFSLWPLTQWQRHPLLLPMENMNTYV
jgi:hypothetical protein